MDLTPSPTGGGGLESLPEEFLERLENVQVDVEEWPDREDSWTQVGLAGRQLRLLGLYHGVPLTERHHYMALARPHHHLPEADRGGWPGRTSEAIASRCATRWSTRSPTTTASTTTAWRSWAGTRACAV